MGAYLDGTNADERVAQHLAGCSVCELVAARALRAGRSPLAGGGDEQPELAAGEQLDRYLVLEPVGRGAAGVVYAAWDSRLDRRVALKVLRQPSADAEERLVREARVMARVSSPHVVAVHDAGTVGGRFYVAMDFVAGQTLRAWLAAPRGWREILDAFVQAGRGLAAAHLAGVVHRDFKPDNVMVRPDGVVTVGDFGLARAGAATVELPTTAAGSTPLRLTSTGLVVGTPAYMAPEQHLGEPATPRSDLFAFCVALHEALFRAHPFGATSYESLRRAVLGGQLSAAPPGPVPRRVRRAVRAGLARRPEERPASMDALLAQLARRPERGLAGAAALALAIGAPLAISAATHRPRPAVVCDGGAARLAGVWDETRRAATRSAFAASGSPSAAQALPAVERAFDAYAQSWTAAHREACEASARGEQSAARLDERMACLDELRTRWASLAGLLAAADRGAVERSTAAAYDLPDTRRCATLSGREARALPGPAEAPLFVVARGGLERARALAELGRNADARTALQPVLAVSRRAGFLELEAEAQMIEARMVAPVDPEAAVRALHAAAVAATAAGRIDLSADAKTALVRDLGFLLVRTEEALLWADHAAAEIARLHDDLAFARLLVARGATLLMTSRPYLAHPFVEAALALYERRLGPAHPRVADAARWVGISLEELGAYAQAEPYLARAARIDEAAYGALHPETLALRLEHAYCLSRLLRHDEALAILIPNFAASLQVLGPGHIDVAAHFFSLSGIYIDRGQYGDAAAAAERGLAIAEGWSGGGRVPFFLARVAWAKALGGDRAAADAASLRLLGLVDQGRAEARLAFAVRGFVLEQTGRCAEAVPIYERAITAFETDQRARDPAIAESLGGLGRCQAKLGRAPAAASSLERALAVAEKGPALIPTAETLCALAELRLAARDADGALDLAARALALLGDGRATPPLVARARALMDRARARRPPPSQSLNATELRAQRR